MSKQLVSVQNLCNFVVQKLLTYIRKLMQMVLSGSSYFDGDVKISDLDVINKYTLNDGILFNNAISRFIFYIYALFLMKSISNRLDKAIKKLKSSSYKFKKNPLEIIERMRELIDKIYVIEDHLDSDKFFSSKQHQKLSTVISSILNKLIRIESLALKEYNKNKPKIDESHLINLVITNNQIELQKKLSS
ncbi:hypothetical protein PYS58_16390 [Chryseobacterium indologenes]|uniref:hypothetical protein n=1 Tax=Chryseobacterium TaxID=59732 RepID=UPI0016257520|nr:MULTISPECIES: hypothetical protein [Chryseobacterium]WET48144.1 hypothetical protein PYS58_16390 [Chryseobacterium indologenes]